MNPPWVGGVTLGGIRAIRLQYIFRYHNRCVLCETLDLCAYVMVSCLVLRVLTSVWLMICTYMQVVPLLLQWYCRMIFHIVDYVYLPFWWATWNAIIFWHAIEVHSWRVPYGINQSTYVASFIREMPLNERWTEVTLTLWHLTLCREECDPFSFRSLVELLLWAESYIDCLGFTSWQRNVLLSSLSKPSSFNLRWANASPPQRLRGVN